MGESSGGTWLEGGATWKETKCMCQHAPSLKPQWTGEWGKVTKTADNTGGNRNRKDYKLFKAPVQSPLTSTVSLSPAYFSKNDSAFVFDTRAPVGCESRIRSHQKQSHRCVSAVLHLRFIHFP